MARGMPFRSTIIRRMYRISRLFTSDMMDSMLSGWVNSNLVIIPDTLRMFRYIPYPVLSIQMYSIIVWFKSALLGPVREERTDDDSGPPDYGQGGGDLPEEERRSR